MSDRTVAGFHAIFTKRRRAFHAGNPDIKQELRRSRGGAVDEHPAMFFRTFTVVIAFDLMKEAPTAEEVEHMFARILDGARSRDEADRWAAQWYGKDDAPRMPAYIWKALGRLHGCDLRHGRDELYLHDHEQIAGWLEEFRLEMREHET